MREMTIVRALGLTVGVLAMLFVAGDLSAGKPERERVKELQGLAKKAEAQVKTACGCGAPISLDVKSFAAVGDMFRCHDTVSAIQEAAVAQCTNDQTQKRDAENSKAYCANVRGYQISHLKTEYEAPKLDTKKKTIQTWCSDMKYTNSDELKKILEAF